MLRLLVILAAVLASALPLLWMAILFVAQSGNVTGPTQYWDEFPFIVAFWVGFAAASVFAASCFTQKLTRRRILLLTPFILLGIVGGVAEEIILGSDAKVSFHIGFFELAPLSWVVAGLVARLWPNKWFQPTSQPRVARLGRG